MRTVYAIDEKAMESHTKNLPECIKWAQHRSEATQRPIKIVVCRAGEKQGRTIAEVTSAGVRLIKSGSLWPRKKLEALHGEN